MTEKQTVVQNEAGIHCRPASVILTEVKDYSGVIRIRTPRGECRLKSAMDLLMLAIEQGTEVTVRVEGPDEEATCNKLIEMFSRIYDFPNAGEGMA